MKTLFLAWQAPDRQWFPVGRLMADVAQHKYEFDYLNGALQARDNAGFSPLLAFPDFDRHYQSSELFPLFKNRVLRSSRKGYADYIRSLGLDPDHSDPLEVLAISGGERQTDSFEVFPKINKAADGSFSCRFFLHGLRYVNSAGAERAAGLEENEPLQIHLETNNPKTGLAIMLTSTDYLPLGWTPRYLVADLLKAMSQSPNLSAHVVKVNPAGTPGNRRFLIQMDGQLPAGFEPMSGSEFQPLH